MYKAIRTSTRAINELSNLVDAMNIIDITALRHTHRATTISLDSVRVDHDT